jgi:hypothetical protein
MIITTRVNRILYMYEEHCGMSPLNSQNPNNKVYITTEKPASLMSIEELEKAVNDNMNRALIAKAKEQMTEAYEILKDLHVHLHVSFSNNVFTDKCDIDC